MSGAGIVVIVILWLVTGVGATMIGAGEVRYAKDVGKLPNRYSALMVLTGLVLAPLWFVLIVGYLWWVMISETMAKFDGVLKDSWSAVLGKDEK